MKKIFTLIAAAFVATGASAQTQFTLGGQGENGEWSWGWTQQFSGVVSPHFSSQWGEFNLATELKDAQSVKLTVAEANPAINLVVYNPSDDEKQYIAIDKTEVTATLKETDTKVGLQSTEANQDLEIVSFVLVDAAGKETQTTYSTNWGVSFYTGKYTTQQWAELYLIGSASDEAQDIKLTFNEAVPEDALQLKAYYADGTDGYPTVPAGTEAIINIPAAVKAVSLQAKDAYTIDIKSAERVDATAISAVTVVKAQQNGERYNLAGQRVGRDYKGIVIENGKKYLVK